MQDRSIQALTRARIAETLRDDAQGRLKNLAFNSKYLSDGMVSSREVSIQGDISSAEQMLAEAQADVDDIREEYSIKASEAAQQYQRDFQSLWSFAGSSLSSLDRFGSSPSAIIERLTGYDNKALDMSFENARRDPSRLPELLATLSECTPEQLHIFFEQNPELAYTPLFPEGTSTANIFAAKGWWSGTELTDQQRSALMSAAPGFVGNLDGVPYSVRHQVLSDFMQNLLRGEVWPVPGEKMDADTEIALQKIEDSLQNEAEGSRQLVVLDLSNVLTPYRDKNPDNNVLSAMSIGKLDDSQNTTVLVHGIQNSVYGTWGDLVTQGQALYNRRGVYADGTPQAVIIWAGYDAPPSPGEQAKLLAQKPLVPYYPYEGGELGKPGSPLVRRPDAAERGGVRLAGFTDGYLATRASDAEHLNEPVYSIIAHSYGTTVATYALTRTEGTVHGYFMLASAGPRKRDVETANAQGLHVESGTEGPLIYYASTNEDWTAPFGYVGTGVLTPDFARTVPQNIDGAIRLETGGGYSLDGKYWEDVDHHSLGKKDNPDFLERFPYDESTQQGFNTPGTTSHESVAYHSITFDEKPLTFIKAEERVLSPRDEWHTESVRGDLDPNDPRLKTMMRQQGLTEEDIIPGKPDAQE